MPETRLFATELVLPPSLHPRSVRALRLELLAFREVREVLPTSSRRAVVVIHDDHAHLEGWRTVLQSAR